MYSIVQKYRKQARQKVDWLENKDYSIINYQKTLQCSRFGEIFLEMIIQRFLTNSKNPKIHLKNKDCLIKQLLHNLQIDYQCQQIVIAQIVGLYCEKQMNKMENFSELQKQIEQKMNNFIQQQQVIEQSQLLQLEKQPNSGKAKPSQSNQKEYYQNWYQIKNLDEISKIEFNDCASNQLAKQTDTTTKSFCLYIQSIQKFRTELNLLQQKFPQKISPMKINRFQNEGTKMWKVEGTVFVTQNQKISYMKENINSKKAEQEVSKAIITKIYQKCPKLMEDLKSIKEKKGIKT